MRLALPFALVMVGLAFAACRAETPTPEPAPTDVADPVAEPAGGPLAEPGAEDPWEAARARGVLFRAVGQEPGWLLDVYPDSVVVLAAYGEDRAVFPAPAPAPEDEAFRFEVQGGGRTLGVEARATPCTNAMSGQPFSSTVTLVLDGEPHAGCGRRLN